MKKRLVRIFKSEEFKKVTLVLGIVFLILTFFISLDPKPFLKFGYFGVFVFNLLFGPGTLLIPSLSRYMNIVALAGISALGMTFNDSISWIVGINGDVILPRSKRVKRVEKVIHRLGPFALFFLALIPIPYDLIGLIAGYLEISYRKFVIPSFLGKLIRFLLLGVGAVTIFGKTHF